MYFPSKKDWWLYPIYWGCVIVCFLPFFIERDYFTLFFTVPFAILLIWCWFTTGYKISHDVLVIQSGPIKQKILIKDIQKIKSTKNPLSSIALSMDRLEITYATGFGMALVSPKDKQKFASLLKESNPQIEVDLNK